MVNRIAIAGTGRKGLMDKLLEIKLPMTGQYSSTKESTPILFSKDKIARQSQIIKDRFGFKHGTKKKSKKKKGRR